VWEGVGGGGLRVSAEAVRTMAYKASESKQSDGRAREGAMATSFPCAEGQVVGKQQQPATRASAMGQRRVDRDYVRASCSTY